VTASGWLHGAETERLSELRPTKPAWIFVLHLQNQRNQAAIKCNGAEAVTAPHLTHGGSSSRSMHSAVRILTMSPTWFLRRRRRRVGTGCSAVHGRRSSSAGLCSTAARRPVSRRRRGLEPALQWQTAAGPGSFQLQVNTALTMTNWRYEATLRWKWKDWLRK